MQQRPAQAANGQLRDGANGSRLTKGSGRGSEIASPFNCKSTGPWSEEEHGAFQEGIRVFGKGAWSQIARSYVQSRTPAQVASHAQKHFIRLQQLASGKVTKRSASSRASQSSMLASLTASGAPGWKEQAENSNQRVGENGHTTSSSAEKSFKLPPRLVIKNGTTVSQQSSGENSGETSLNPPSPVNGNFSSNLPKNDKSFVQSGWDTSASCRLAHRMVGNGGRQQSSQSTAGSMKAAPAQAAANGKTSNGALSGKLPTAGGSKELVCHPQPPNGHPPRTTSSPSPTLSPSPPPSSIQTQAIASSSSGLTTFNGPNSQQAQSSSTPFPPMPWAHLAQHCQPFGGAHPYNPYAWAYGWPPFPPKTANSEHGLDIVEPIACRAIRPQPLRSSGPDFCGSLLQRVLHQNGGQVPSAHTVADRANGS
eukprot:scaffold870_cov393-Prasinococcus_capsulatus_cf.AAC.44